jgi:cobalt-zinc-cadmium efflux system outer membrane protein
MNRFIAPLLVALACNVGLSRPATARESGAPQEAITRARITALLREAPAARVAASEANVSKAVTTAAGVLSLDNPVLSGLGGIRYNPDGERFLAATATLSWPVDVAGQRGSRIDAAKAGERAAVALQEQQARQILQGLLLQHALVLRGDRQIELASTRLAVTERFLAAAERRRTAGSVPELDVTLASLQEKQDRAARAAAIGVRDADRATFLSLLGMPGKSATAAGDLVPSATVPELSVLLAEVSQRPDVRAARAAVDAAELTNARERAARFPTINVLAQYERDEGANIGQLGLAIPLPLLNPNSTDVARTGAEIDVARARAEAVAVQAEGEIRRLYARYVATKQALEALRPATALTTQAVELAARGYELGEGDLASVLLVRREAVAAQAGLLDAEHAHANATIELLVSVGRVPQ